MRSFTASVQPEVLEWARKSARLSIERAAERTNFSVATLESWEAGESAPTFRQLETLAEKYKRPLAVMYLPEPPKGWDALREFRRLTKPVGFELGFELNSALERVRMQQNALEEIYALEDSGPPKFTFEITPQSNVGTVSEQLRQWVGLSDSDQRKWAKQGVFVTRLTDLVEARGVIVTQLQRIPVSAMRGCALTDHTFPAIIINGKDAPTAKAFTVIHELVHVLLRKNSVDNVVPVTADRFRAKNQVERFCNLVSASTLLPERLLTAESGIRNATSSTHWTPEALYPIAHQYGVSAEALHLRLIELGKATWESYEELKPRFVEPVTAPKEEDEDSASPPIFYPLKVRDLGKRYIREVIAAYHRDDINSFQAAEFLTVKAAKIPRLQSEVAKRR